MSDFEPGSRLDLEWKLRFLNHDTSLHDIDRVQFASNVIAEHLSHIVFKGGLPKHLNWHCTPTFNGRTESKIRSELELGVGIELMVMIILYESFTLEVDFINLRLLDVWFESCRIRVTANPEEVVFALDSCLCEPDEAVFSIARNQIKRLSDAMKLVGGKIGKHKNPWRSKGLRQP